MKNVLLVKYGEIALRGKNRYLFEKRLINTMKRNIGDANGYSVTKEQGRILVERAEGDVDFDLILPKVKNILGVVGFCPCIKTEDQQVENLQKLALAYMMKNYPEGGITFKVETRRADKRYPIRSNEVSMLVGGFVLHGMAGLKVDVHNPDVTIHVELRNHAYIYTNMVKGFGGLPAGCSGRGMALLSGGIDSPVASFLMAQRGVDLHAVYFHAPPFTSERAKEKVYDLAQRLSDFTGYVKLYVVELTEIQTHLHGKVQEEKFILFLKRAMLKIAERLAEKDGCQCLITGDSVGQVASQTLQSIQAISSAVQLPILRPLAGLGKQDIVDIAQRIGTYEISIRPYEDCCTLFLPKHPETHPKVSIIERIESCMPELLDMVDRAIEHVEMIEY